MVPHQPLTMRGNTVPNRPTGPRRPCKAGFYATGSGGAASVGLMRDAISAFVTLCVTIGPPGLATLFLTLTASMTRSERSQIAERASLISLAVLLLFALAGTAILAVFGITIHAFRIAGGLLLFKIAFDMIF